MNGFDYSGKMVFVMGGIKGIGWCIVEWFFVVGVCVFVCGCSVFDMLLLVNGCMVVFVVVDLCDIEQVDVMFVMICDMVGGFDVFVNNVGGLLFVFVVDVLLCFIELIVWLNLIVLL